MNKSKSAFFSLVLFLFCYFLSAFLKVSAAVVLPVFQQKMNLSSSAVGLISSMFFISYAVAQLLSGMLCNMFGSHTVMGIGLIISSLGTLCYTIASSPFMIIAGRFLMGLGIGPAFVSTFAFLQENYEGQSYSSISGISIMICNFGSACSSAPLRLLLQRFDIPRIFITLTFIQILVSVLFFIEKKKYRNHSNIRGTGLFGQLGSSCRVIVSSRTVTGLLFIWILYNTFMMVYQGLWITQWTKCAFPSCANIVSISGTLISIGDMIGCLFSDKLRFRKSCRLQSVKVGQMIHVALFILLTAVRSISSNQVLFATSAVIDFFYGLSVGALCVQLTACVRENTDIAHNAVILGIFNFAANVAVQVMQWISGILIDGFSLNFGELFSYSAVFFILSAVLLVFSIFSVGMLDRRN